MAWRFGMIIMAVLAYFPARFLLTAIITGTTASDQLATEIVPIIAAGVAVIAVAFAIK